MTFSKPCKNGASTTSPSGLKHIETYGFGIPQTVLDHDLVLKQPTGDDDWDPPFVGETPKD